MNKLFQRIFWRNNNTPALNETNLNAMSKAIDDIDDRVIELGDDVLTIIPQIQAYLEQADDLVEAMEALSQNPPYIGTNGNWWVWNTSTQAFVDSGIDASITVQIADITMLAPEATPYVTNSGTDTDPVFHLFLPRGQKGADGDDGDDGVSPTITIVAITGGHRITITDADHPQGQSFDVMDGQSGGSGDMQKSVYDSDSAVENAGGIKAYVSTKADKVSSPTSGNFAGLDANGNLTDSGSKASDFKSASAHDSWSEVTNKPFNTVGTGLATSNNALRLNMSEEAIYSIGGYLTDGSQNTVGQIGVQYRRLNADGTAPIVDNPINIPIAFQMLIYANQLAYTFNNAEIKTDSMIDVYSSIWGDNPTSVSVSNGSCTITFSEQKTRQVAIVIKNFYHQA